MIKRRIQKQNLQPLNEKKQRETIKKEFKTFVQTVDTGDDFSNDFMNINFMSRSNRCS